MHDVCHFPIPETYILDLRYAHIESVKTTTINITMGDPSMIELLRAAGLRFDLTSEEIANEDRREFFQNQHELELKGKFEYLAERFGVSCLELELHCMLYCAAQLKTQLDYAETYDKSILDYENRSQD